MALSLGKQGADRPVGVRAWGIGGRRQVPGAHTRPWIVQRCIHNDDLVDLKKAAGKVNVPIAILEPGPFYGVELGEHLPISNFVDMRVVLQESGKVDPSGVIGCLYKAVPQEVVGGTARVGGVANAERHSAVGGLPHSVKPCMSGLRGAQLSRFVETDAC